MCYHEMIKNVNLSEPSRDKDLGEGSDKGLSTQHLRPNIEPIYHVDLEATSQNGWFGGR